MSLADPYPVQPWRRPCRGTVAVPGSKSLTNRMLIMGALSDGEAVLEGALFSRDTQLLADGLRALGFGVEDDREERRFRVRGEGGRIPASSARLEVGNAGTAARFLTAMVCLHPNGRYQLDGDAEMRRRPMAGLVRALENLGARFRFGGQPDCFPFEVETCGLRGGDWEVDARASSQMLSALLQVAPVAAGTVRLQAGGARPAFVEMTRRLMERHGAHLDGTVESGFTVYPKSGYKSGCGVWQVEPDATAAGYFLTLPLVVGGEVRLAGFGKELLQGDSRYIDVLETLGLRVEQDAGGWLARRVGGCGSYQNREYDFEFFSDCFPTLAAAAPYLGGRTTIRGIGHTRWQECDRPSVVAAGLRACGVEVEEQEDRLVIGGFRRADGQQVRVKTAHDHRMAMAFALCGCGDRRGDGEPWLAVENPACCGKTFPDFFRKLNDLYLESHD